MAWALTAPQATFCGALIALLGVLAGLVSNGMLSRNRLQNDRAHEVRALRTMLVAELESLIGIVEGELKHLSSCDETWVPLLDFLKVYRDQPERIAVLSQEEVSAIATAYYVYQERSGYIARRADLDLTKVYLGTNATFDFRNMEDGQSRKSEVVGDLSPILPPVKLALRALISKGGFRSDTLEPVI